MQWVLSPPATDYYTQELLDTHSGTQRDTDFELLE